MEQETVHPASDPVVGADQSPDARHGGDDILRGTDSLEAVGRDHLQAEPNPHHKSMS